MVAVSTGVALCMGVLLTDPSSWAGASLLPSALPFLTEKLCLLSSCLPPPPKSSLVALSPCWRVVTESAAQAMHWLLPAPACLVPIPEPRSGAQLCHLVGCPSVLLKEEVTFERVEEDLSPGLGFWGSQDTAQNERLLVYNQGKRKPWAGHRERAKENKVNWDNVRGAVWAIM